VVATMRAVPGVTMHVNLLTPMAAALTQLRIGAIVSVLVPAQGSPSAALPESTTAENWQSDRARLIHDH